MQTRINHSASAGLTFLFSLLPGAGHMYLGLMRRGMELMALFFGTIFIITEILGLAEIGVPLSIVIYFYSIFDAYHLRRSISQGQSVEDENIIKIGKHTLNGYHIGIGIIVIGVFFLFDRLSYTGFIPGTLYWNLKRALAPMALMGVGLYFILRARQAEEQKKLEESLTKTE